MCNVTACPPIAAAVMNYGSILMYAIITVTSLAEVTSNWDKHIDMQLAV